MCGDTDQKQSPCFSRVPCVGEMMSSHTSAHSRAWELGQVWGWERSVMFLGPKCLQSWRQPREAHWRLWLSPCSFLAGSAFSWILSSRVLGGTRFQRGSPLIVVFFVLYLNETVSMSVLKIIIVGCKRWLWRAGAHALCQGGPGWNPGAAWFPKNLLVWLETTTVTTTTKIVALGMAFIKYLLKSFMT